MTRAPAISVRGLRVVRGGHLVLPSIDLDVEAGTVTGLLGPSGGGKTTLLRSIVGVQRVAAGDVQVLGERAGSPGLRRQVAYATQAPAVYPDLSVEENLRYFAAVAGATADDVERSLAQTRLEDARSRPASRLSGGQRSRLSLATTLLASPKVLILDEPTVGLDPLLRRELWGLFHELARAGATLLVSSHVMDEADRCHRLLLMRDGEIVAHDTPQALLAATGTPTIEEAFIALITGKEAA